MAQEANESSPICAGWEHNFVRLGVESRQEFRDEARFHRAGFAGRHDVADDRIDPRDLIDPKKDARMRPDFQFVYRRFPEQLTINAHAFLHIFADFFLDDALHRLGDELQVALICDLKFDLVPDIGKSGHE